MPAESGIFGLAKKFVFAMIIAKARPYASRAQDLSTPLLEPEDESLLNRVPMRGKQSMRRVRLIVQDIWRHR